MPSRTSVVLIQVRARIFFLPISEWSQELANRRSLSPISYGAWPSWRRMGPPTTRAMLSLHRASTGVNFFDTADVYGDGHSERLIGQLRRERTEEIIVATKAGRRLDPHVAEGFTRENLTAFVERSLRNLDTDAIDLLQLHCPPPDVYDMPEVFGILDDLVAGGKLRFYGVSVERVEEALRLRGIRTSIVQIIFNMFRQKRLRSSSRSCARSASASSLACRWRAVSSAGSCGASRRSPPRITAATIAMARGSTGRDFSGVTTTRGSRRS